MRSLLWLLAGATACAASASSAQEPASDLSKAFYAAADAYRDDVRKIEKLWADYQTADDAQQKTINQELESIVASAKTKVNAMVDAALEAYQADPKADPQVAAVLAEAAKFKVAGDPKQDGADQYESALPIITALVDGDHDEPALPVWGMLSALAVNDFDAAERFTKLAQEQGSSPELIKSGSAQQMLLSYLSDPGRYRARWEEEKKIRDAEAAADNNPRVKMQLTAGDVVIELFEDQAPIATANFLSLVKDGFYDGVVFHRVLPHFMAQGGDPTGTGTGGPGHNIKCECYRPDARGHFRGTLSMAHAGRDTGGSQFFLCFVPTDFLDGRHTAFGRVVEGIEVIGEIQTIDPDQRGGKKPDEIVKAEVLRDRGHDYDFEKLPGR